MNAPSDSARPPRGREESRLLERTVLEGACQLEQVALDSYQLAIEALDGSALVDELRPFRDSHRLRQQQLASKIVALNGTPCPPGDAWPRLRTLCKTSHVGEPHAQRALLEALRAGELALHDVYHAYDVQPRDAAVSFLKTYVMPEHRRTIRDLRQLMSVTM